MFSAVQYLLHQELKIHKMTKNIINEIRMNTLC